MYYPVQIPYILNKEFSQAVRYTEEVDTRLSSFVICFWNMEPRISEAKTIKNIIIADGCIDLVVDFFGKSIGFAGMRKTDFNFEMSAPCRYFGVRFKAGAFHAITGKPAGAAMDTFLPINEVYGDFDIDGFFALPIDKAKDFFKNYIGGIIRDKAQGGFLRLFDALSDDIPDTAAELYKRLHFSERQCQRLFDKHYGLTPQTALCILRFQKCLEILTSERASPSDALTATNYYDQAHFINDFKRRIGLTPFELIRKYR